MMHCPQALLARQQSSLTASSRFSTVVQHKQSRQPRRNALISNQPVVATSLVDKDSANEGKQAEQIASRDVNDTAAGGVRTPLIRAPEDFTLPVGQLSTVDRHSEVAPEDVYRCAGCTRSACQVLW